MLHAPRGLAIVVVASLLVPCAACRSVSRAGNAMAGHAAAPSAIDGAYVRGAGTPSVPDPRDCNGNALDGRETDVRTSRDHCGACGAACRGSCVDGVCAPSPSAAPPPSTACTVDDDCTIARFDAAAATPCCTCNLVAITKSAASTLGCGSTSDAGAPLSMLCVLSCLQPSGVTARCTAGECRLSR